MSLADGNIFFRIMYLTDGNIFFHCSLPQGLNNNSIPGNNTYDAFFPIRTSFIVSLRYFEMAKPHFLEDLEQQKMKQLALTIAI